MASCPVCGIEAPDGGACPRCHLAAELFAPVREAAGPRGGSDPAYLRTIGELLASVDLEKTPPPVPAATKGLLSRPDPRPELAGIEPASLPSPEPAPPLDPRVDLPLAPTSMTELADAQRRIREYFEIGRRLDLDFADFGSRASAAVVAADLDSLEVLAREMFVHVTSAVVEEYESLLAHRNELAPLVATHSADVELAAVRRAIGVGDFAGAVRRLNLVRDALGQLEQEWEVGRILVTEGELMASTIRELGGDPGPAAGPLEQGRKLFAEGHRVASEQVLARAAVALWTLLQPRLLADLRRIRDRMVEVRDAGLDIEPAVQDLRTVSRDLSKRNLVGAIVAYRRLRAFAERVAGPPGNVSAPAGEVRSAPQV